MITLEELFELAYEPLEYAPFGYTYVDGYKGALKRRTEKYIYLLNSYAIEIVMFDDRLAPLSSLSEATIQKVLNIFKKMRNSVKSIANDMFKNLDMFITILQINDSLKSEEYLINLNTIRCSFVITMKTTYDMFLKKYNNLNYGQVIVWAMEDLISVHDEQFDVAYFKKKDPKEKKKLIEIFDKIEKLVEEEYRESIGYENQELKEIETNYMRMTRLERYLIK